MCTASLKCRNQEAFKLWKWQVSSQLGGKRSQEMLNQAAEQPSGGSMLAILQKCRKEKNLYLAKYVHAHICDNGLEAYQDVGNYIVPMFMECGSLSDAHESLSRMPHRNEHSWTSVIIGHIELGQSEHAFSLYQKMQEDSVCPSAHTLTALVRACARVKDLEKGRHIHVEIRKKGFEMDPYIGNTLVNMYAKCGSLAEAQEVFDKLSVRHVVSWNTLISGFAENGLDREALNCFEQMQCGNTSPNTTTFVCCLKACTNISAIDKGREIHTILVQMGFLTDLFVGNALVDMYAKCGSLTEAQDVFKRMPIRDVISWNTIIAGFTDNGKVVDALNCFDKMHLDGISPNIISYVGSLKACGAKLFIDKGREIHMEIRTKGFERDPFIVNSLVCMYAKCGALMEARKIFDRHTLRNVISWNALIAGYSENGLNQEALKCFEQMQQENISPDSVTIISSLKACGSLGALDKTREIHNVINQKGFEDVYMSNALIETYAKCGSLMEARDVFDKIRIRNIISWNTLIAGYAGNGLSMESLKCFELMQQNGISPNVPTFICILKACGSMGILDKIREIQAKVFDMGYKDINIGNTLIDMYVKCGSLGEACEVFNKMPVRDAVSWTTMIGGYAEHGHSTEALECFEQMQFEGILPDAFTFVSILKACSIIGTLRKGREIHAEISRTGFEGNIFVANALINVYNRCGSVDEAWNVFNKLQVRSVVSWTATIAGFSENGLYDEALRCFEEMILEGVSPNKITFLCTLKASGSIGAIGKGRELHIAISKRSSEWDSIIWNSLIDMYVKCGSLLEAEDVFDKLLVRDSVAWNTLLAGYADHGFALNALKCLKQMQLEDVTPNAVTFVCVLKVCSCIGSIDYAQEIHREIMQRGLEKDIFVGNSLIDMYARCGLILEAQKVFDNLPFRDEISWNSLIAGYVESGFSIEALSCYERMQLNNMSPSAATFLTCLKACGNIGHIGKGQSLHAEIVQKGFEKSLLVGNALLDMYVKCCALAEAQDLFDKMPHRDVVSWTTMIAGFVELGYNQKALKCLVQMQLVGVSPDPIAFVWGLKCCGNMLALEEGRKLHNEIGQLGFNKDLLIGSSLIDMYAKCGSLLEARLVFDNLPARDVVSWNAVIRGYGMNHDGKMAVECFHDMEQDGIKPDGITFLSLLTACSHANLLVRGQKYFKAMKEKYNIVPTADHYICMIDLLARSGQLYEAQRLIQIALCCPSIEAWTALLSACRIYGETGLGLRCYQKLLETNPENAASYVLMANIYTSTDKWDDATVRNEELTKHAGAQKTSKSNNTSQQ